MSDKTNRPAALQVLTLAALAIMTSSALGAEQRTPARMGRLVGVVSSPLSEPRSARAEAAPASCPYHFGSEMPAATFCVYRGIAFDGRGEVCATDVVVIWRSLGSHGPVSGADKVSGTRREVYLGFVADPELIVRAITDLRHDNRAEMVGYTLGSAEIPQRLAGRMTLPAQRPGSAAVEPTAAMPWARDNADWKGYRFG